MIHIERDLEEAQVQREASQRDAALGRRLQMMRDGNLSPVIRRWINSDVAPIAELLRQVAHAYLAGRMEEVAVLLDAPTAELSGSERPLRPLMEWMLRGKSPGRVNEEGTFADDVVLSFMATAIHWTVRPKKEKAASVSAVLANCADALRDTILGQFITSIQGASAMQAIRERQSELWKQKKSLNRICNQLVSQVRPQLLEEEAGLRTLEMRGRKKVMRIMSRGEERMLSLVPPDATAWEILSLCYQEEGTSETSSQRSLWLGLAGIILSAAQKTGGWFDVGEDRTKRRGHTRTTKLLLLSDRAHDAIKRDAERWVSMGFEAEPMLVPPEDGDYLTVKHRKVTGQKSPLGLGTKPEETTPWLTGACVLGTSPWTVNPYALASPSGVEDAPTLMRMASHRRLAQETFYLPVTMDFRGRIYYRPTWVTPQSGDLGKSLLCFPAEVKHWAEWEQREPHNALIMHLAGLYGGPDKVDKAPLSARVEWFASWNGDTSKADKPLTLAAHMALINAGDSDRIPIQLDGTCNGLQHLSALFRDEEGAKHVNLVKSSLEDRPADIYGVVAERVGEVITHYMNREHQLHYAELPPAWVTRFEEAHVYPDRKLCKGPVMVLPYGGTREAVRLSVKASLLERLTHLGHDTPWHRYEEDSYAAFKERDLADHPLFNTDSGQLAGLIWDCIAPAIPKAMAAMSALQAIGSYVGERGLSWRVGTGPVESRLWVTQAKSKAARKQVTMKGFHLPSLVRRLTLNAHMNEVDPRAHRTGIVANFIHSQDAAHLAATVALFRGRGGGCVGSVHDCLMVRPSEAKLMGECLRDAFVELYTVPADDWDPLKWEASAPGWEERSLRCGPLWQPVRLIDPLDEANTIEYPSWYALAEAAGVEFPEWGSFDITEVRESAWFFS
jgi:hypothetical protein